MAQQTPVEWLVDKLKKGEFINNPDELIEQAKQMEKNREIQFKDAFEQAIINAFHAGQRVGMYNTSVITAQGQMSTGQQYFNQTHKKHNNDK